MLSNFSTTEFVLLSIASLSATVVGIFILKRFILRAVNKVLLNNVGSLPIFRIVDLNHFYKSLPGHFIVLLTLMEDDQFWHHFGVNLPELSRSLRFSITHKTLKGGSSITQQVAKQLLFKLISPSVTIRGRLLRKLLEIPLSFLLEANFSKEKILSIYLENIPYVQGVCGINGATRGLLHKFPHELSIAESFILIWMISNPLKSHNRILSKTRPEQIRVDYDLAYEKILILTRIIREHSLSSVESFRDIPISRYAVPSNDTNEETEFIRITTKRLHEIYSVVQKLKTTYHWPVKFLHSYLTLEHQCALGLMAQSDNLNISEVWKDFHYVDQTAIEKFGRKHSVLSLFYCTGLQVPSASYLSDKSTSLREEIIKRNNIRYNALVSVLTVSLQIDPSLLVGGDLLLVEQLYEKGERSLDFISLYPSSTEATLKLKDVLLQLSTENALQIGSNEECFSINHFGIVISLIHPQSSKWIDRALISESNYCELKDSGKIRILTATQEFIARVNSDAVFLPKKIIELLDYKKLLSVDNCNLTSQYLNGFRKDCTANERMAISITYLLLGLNLPSVETGYYFHSFFKKNERKISTLIRALLEFPETHNL